jgi:hypothetical protein
LDHSLSTLVIPYSYDFIVSWTIGIPSRERSASILRYSNDSIELNVNIATILHWAPYASESRGKDRSNVFAGLIDSYYGSRELQFLSRMKKVYICV